MDIVNTFLIALHLLGLVLAMGAGIALGILMPRLGGASESERGRLFGIGDVLVRNARIGLGLLWVTGILVLFLKYGDLGAMSLWFWAKMALVVVLSASIGMGAAAYRKFRAGNTAASTRMAMAGKLNMVVGPLVILFAVFAFG